MFTKPIFISSSHLLSSEKNTFFKSFDQLATCVILLINVYFETTSLEKRKKRITFSDITSVVREMRRDIQLTITETLSGFLMKIFWNNENLLEDSFPSFINLFIIMRTSNETNWAEMNEPYLDFRVSLVFSTNVSNICFRFDLFSRWTRSLLMN